VCDVWSTEVEMKTTDWIAACGIDCEACEIRRLPFDDDAAKACVTWYREMGWLTADEGAEEALARNMTCNGCRGDRSVHWSVKDGKICWILECCVDGRGLAHCSECEGFPCARLAEWSKENDGYRRAFARLGEMARGL